MEAVLTETDSLCSVRNVLRMEAEGILSLADAVDERYRRLISLCAKCRGKVVFTGMGKSGHVARKISATMASLGTPSFFLHPAEAAHGDLGMVQERDIVIMISKSGETEELIQLMNSLRLIGCKLAGIFCHEDSTLERYCDLTIVIPVEREACIYNLAPTTSTTVTMALGDALAVALSELNGFRDVDFALYHPRGTLGKRLLTTAGTLLRPGREEAAVREEETVEKVLWVITRGHLGAAAVVDGEGRLAGLVTDGDIRRGLEKREDILHSSVAGLMTRQPVYVKESMLAVDVFRLMQEKRISVVPVVDDGGLLTGMISMHDIVAAGIIL